MIKRYATNVAYQIRVSRMKQIFKFVIPLLILVRVTSAANLENLLNIDIYAEPQVVLFQNIETTVSEIATVRLMFLTGPDCYSGYIDKDDNQASNAVFLIEPRTLFGLNAHEVYHSARRVVQTDEQLTKIHSLLIRFYGPKRQLARFLGSCQDQGINCCIPIECSVDTKLCLPFYPFEEQDIQLTTQ